MYLMAYSTANFICKLMNLFTYLFGTNALANRKLFLTPILVLNKIIKYFRYYSVNSMCVLPPTQPLGLFVNNVAIEGIHHKNISAISFYFSVSSSKYSNK